MMPTMTSLPKTKQVALGLSNPEPLVPDKRVERVFYQLQAVSFFPLNTKFATYIQEPTEKEPRRLAVFMVETPHPKNKKKSLITVNPIDYETWVEIEKSYRHYANLSDPIRPIFAGTFKRHMKHWKNLNEVS